MDLFLLGSARQGQGGGLVKKVCRANVHLSIAVISLRNVPENQNKKRQWVKHKGIKGLFLGLITIATKNIF